MGMEYKVLFREPGWYRSRRCDVVNRIRSEPLFVCDGTAEGEFWLKESGKSGLPYDVRVFALADELRVEVTVFSRAFSEGIARLLSWIQRATNAELVDDDGVPLTVPPPPTDVG